MRLILAFVFAPLLMLGADPYKLSELDQERAKRINLQINALRLQYESSVTPVVQEQQALIERVCKAAAIPVADCVINPDSGTVTRREVDKTDKQPEKK